MNYSRQRAVSDGTLQTLGISLAYFKRENLSVLLDGVLTNAWSWVGSLDSIHFDYVIPNGIEVTVQRKTQINKVMHEFSLGASFTNKTMDDDFRQMLYLAQEYTEGLGFSDMFSNLNAHGFQVNNLGDGVLPGDAVNRRQLDAVEASVSGATAAAIQAANEATAAAIRADSLRTDLAIGNGSLVSVTLHGGTRRPLNTRLSECVLLTDFGAVGDGVADDTAAWTKALDYIHAVIPYRTLIVPYGKYTTTKRIDLRPGARLVGFGRRGSSILYSGGGIAVRISDEFPNHNTFAFGGGVENVDIVGNSGCSDILMIKNVNHVVVRDVNLREANMYYGTGLRVMGTVCGYFENIVCSTNAQPMVSRPQTMLVVDRDPDNLSRATANTFVHAIIEGSIGDGIQLVNSDQSVFLGGTSENHTGNGCTIAAGSRMNTFTSMAFENSIGFADVADFGFSNRFVNCYTKMLVYIGPSALYSRWEGGFHQRFVDEGDFSTIQDLKYSFFANGGTVTINSTTSTRNLFNVELSAITFHPKPVVPVTVSGSPFAYTNNTGSSVAVIVRGSGVTQIVFMRNGGPIESLPIGGGMFYLGPTDGLTISFTSAPAVISVPMGTNYM